MALPIGSYTRNFVIALRAVIFSSLFRASAFHRHPRDDSLATRHESGRAWDIVRIAIDCFENDTQDERRDRAVPRDIVGWLPCTKADRQRGKGGEREEHKERERKEIPRRCFWLSIVALRTYILGCRRRWIARETRSQIRPCS